MMTNGEGDVRRARLMDEEKRELAVLDLATGDYQPAITWVRQKWKGESFFMGFQEAFAELAQKRLGSEAKDVFLLILGRVDYDNRVTLPQVEMARLLGMKRQNVSRAVAALIREGVLVVEEPLLGRNRRLRLNDRYGWKGKLKNLRTQRKSTPKGK
jgi:hypothetical protein